jgi:hypothetical protein
MPPSHQFTALVVGGRWRWSSRGRSWLTRDRVRFHHLNPGSVGIVDVHLTSLMDAGGNPEVFSIRLECAPTAKCRKA